MIRASDGSRRHLVRVPPLSRTDPVPGLVRSSQRFVRGSQLLPSRKGLAMPHCWLTNRRNIPATIARAIRIPTTNAISGCRLGLSPFDPAPFCAAPMPSQKGRLLIASSQANSQVAEGYGSRWLVSTAHMAACYAPLAANLALLPLAGLAVRAPSCKPELGARLLGGADSRTADAINWIFCRSSAALRGWPLAYRSQLKHMWRARTRQIRPSSEVGAGRRL
jgi:hypothetical protein